MYKQNIETPNSIASLRSYLRLKYEKGYLEFCEIEKLDKKKVKALLYYNFRNLYWQDKICKILNININDIKEWRKNEKTN